MPVHKTCGKPLDWYPFHPIKFPLRAVERMSRNIKLLQRRKRLYGLRLNKMYRILTERAK